MDRRYCGTMNEWSRQRAIVELHKKFALNAGRWHRRRLRLRASGSDTPQRPCRQARADRYFRAWRACKT